MALKDISGSTPAIVDKGLFQSVVEQIFDGIAIVQDEKYIYANSALIKMWGKPAEDIVGRYFLDLIHPAEHEHLVEIYKQRMSGSGPIAPYEIRGIRANGDTLWVEMTGSLIEHQGRPADLVTVRDISKRKSAEQFSRQTADTLEMLATGQATTDIYNAIALMYESRHPGMRCSLLELKGDRLIHGGAPSLPEAYCKAVNGLQYGPGVGSCGASTYTGNRVLVEDIATDPNWAELKSVALPHGLRCCWSEPIKSATGEVIGAFSMYYNHPALPDEEEIRDLVSASRLAGIAMERELREKKMHQLSSAIQQAGESIMITDMNGIIEYVNPYFTRLTGYSAEEAMGKTPKILSSGKQDEAFYKTMWQTINSGKVWRGKIIDRKKDGSFYSARLTISPVCDDAIETAGCTHFIGIQSDLSEIEDLESKFYQAQKMEAIGTLVGGIAHDFNNMLAGMTGNLYLAKKRAQDMPDVVEKLSNVEKLSFRAADMIQQLLAFARKSRVSMKPVPLTPFIKEVIKLIYSSVPENITICQDICNDRLKINGDGTQLHQALMNLVNNARDAVESAIDPTITVRLEAFQTEDVFLATHAYFTPGHYAHLSVEDNGYGIPEDQIEHLFEPFFTTKEVGKGTGLGLAMVFGAVKTHQGFIEVDSIEGKGSNFHVYLPLLEPEEDAHISVKESAVTEGHGELILLADEEQQVLDTTQEVLEALGYRVLTATNGQQAVEVFEAHANEIDLCLFDVVMPVLSGDKAAEHIRQLHRGAKVIFATGYDRNLLSRLEDEAVLTKPFTIEALSSKIREQLDHALGRG